MLVALALIDWCRPLAVAEAASTQVAATDAENEETVLDDIVVTATSDIKVLDTPASISVITAKDLEAQGVRNIAEALTRIPGVFDDGSSNYYLSIRGTRSSSSGGPLVLIDGVPQDTGLLGYNYRETIPVSEIERIEVLRSPGSTVFGADSARGVISIVTKKAKPGQAFSGQVSASAGSWNTFDESASISGGLGVHERRKAVSSMKSATSISLAKPATST